jgi:hypothetical protein
MEMTLEEYKERAEDEDFVPGWDAIDACLRRLYGEQQPRHLAPPIQTRAICGGDCYLDGCSIYPSSKGYQHMITYGMTDLYYNDESFGEEHSGWGFELTMKYRLPNNSATEELDKWATNVMMDLARYANTRLK